MLLRPAAGGRAVRQLVVRHATPETLASLEPLLRRLKAIGSLREKTAGVFYLGSRAFLHFHEHDGAIFADVRLHPPDFDRLPVTTKTEQNLLVRSIREHLR